MKFFIMQSSPASHHFLPIRSKYSVYVLPLVTDEVSHSYKTTNKMMFFFIY